MFVTQFKLCANLLLKANTSKRVGLAAKSPWSINLASSYHSTTTVRGIEEFFEDKKPNEVFVTGRAWTAVDLRRKNFNDLHSLWYVLYKERNLLLSEKERRRRMKRPTTPQEEFRYMNVKRSMAAIKRVVHERKLIKKRLNPENTDQTEAQ